MSFSGGVEDWAEKTKRRIRVARYKIAFEVFQRVILKTPVRSGRARGNWQPKIGSPTAQVIDTTDQALGLNQLEPVLAGIRDNDDPIVLFNNLPYIEKLEDGWSQQAPAGMVATTIVEYQGIADKAIEEASRES